MKIHLIQTAVDEKNTESNIENAAAKIKGLKGGGIAVLPELFISGYDKGNIEYWGNRWQHAVYEISEAAKSAKVSVIFTTPVSEKGKRFNRAIFINEEGTLISTYDKIHLFRLMDEDKYFSQGSNLETFPYEEWTVGINICYDLRFPEGIRALYKKGANLIILPAAWPHARTDVFKKLCFARAIENQCYFITCNRASHSESKPTYAGNSMIIAPDGELLAECGVDEDYATAEINLEKVVEYRKQITCIEDRRDDIY